jgi:DNA-directed RNA polymerase specialized sigma24 family protein
MAFFSCSIIAASLRALAGHLVWPYQCRSDRRLAEMPDKRDRYRMAVAALPARTRTIYLLHRADGLSIAQIAERTKRPSSDIEHDIAEAILAIGRTLDDGEV